MYVVRKFSTQDLVQS